MRIFSSFVLSLGILIASAPLAWAKAPGCNELRSAMLASQLAAAEEGRDLLRELRLASRALCSRLTPAQGATVTYPNGRIATTNARTQGATWYYPNGRIITNYAGQVGATWYYPNGRIVSNYAGQAGATWYYPNGRIITNYADQKGATWYYPNGRIITNYAGQKGATWYYPNGRIITNYMGQRGATWYHENGAIWLSSGPELSEQELLRVLHVLNRVLDDQNDEDED